MAGHILLVSCLLAVCLPIIFVQLPRFETIEELRAENEVETRSSLLRRRPLSPSTSRKLLRRITRPQSETDIDITSAESGQEQVDPKQVSQMGTQRGRDTEIPKPIVQGDACADSGPSSNEKELRKARAGKKPWDPPFKRQPPRTEINATSSRERWHPVEYASPPRKTGREMEARGVAMRLFPPDPVPDHDPCSTVSSGPLQPSQPLSRQAPQEPWHRQTPSKSHVQSYDKRGAPRERQSGPPTPQVLMSQCTDSESLPSSLDGSPLPSMCPLLQSVPPTRNRERSSCPYRYCGHAHSEALIPQSQNIAAAPEAAPEETPKQNSKGPSCRCKHEDFDSSAPQSQGAPSAAVKEALKNASEEPLKEAPREAPKALGRARKLGMALWQTLLITMGSIICVFSFAILIAHCLAWFLVYKTEARLGEVRSGLLKGGDMRLCLCGRG